MLAAVFIFSGFVKACDPLGMAYKVEAYFAEFGMVPPVMGDIRFSVVAAVVLGAFEFLLGVYLLAGIHRRFTSWCTLVVMGGMTVLTAYLYFFSAIPDCGCFGEAIVLSNRDTLLKNLVLLLLAASLLWAPRRMARIITQRNQWILALYSVSYIFILSVYTLYHIPVLDFTPYKVGTDLVAATQGEYETVFDYEKDGHRQTFDINHLPAAGDWTFVEARTNVIRQPEIESLVVLDGERNMTDSLLADTGYVFLLTSPGLDEADAGCSDFVNDLYDYCVDHGYAFYALTPPDSAAQSRWTDVTGASYPFLAVDEENLKAMVRSNPGMLLLKDGKILGKWGHNDFAVPAGVCEADRPLQTAVLDRVTPGSLSSRVLAVILWFVVPLFLVVMADRIWISSKFYRHYIFKRNLNSSKKDEKENRSRQLENEQEPARRH